MTPEVSAAVEEIRAMFPENDVLSEDDSEGGAYVTVTGVDLGPQYEPSVAACSFRIPFQYPRADVYPHYLLGGVRRRDGQSRQGVQQDVTWRDQRTVQLSRRSNKWNPAIDTAALKLAKVLEWFKTL